jgi:transcription initiation factor TFIID subunit TAF12
MAIAMVAAPGSRSNSIRSNSKHPATPSGTTDPHHGTAATTNNHQRQPPMATTMTTTPINSNSGNCGNKTPSPVAIFPLTAILLKLRNIHHSYNQ